MMIFKQLQFPGNVWELSYIVVWFVCNWFIKLLINLYMIIHLVFSVAQAYLNQKKLDAEAKQLHQSAIVFSKQTSQWLSLIDNFNGALKELGDVENWTRTIENDMRNITTTLEYAYKGNKHVLLWSVNYTYYYNLPIILFCSYSKIIIITVIRNIKDLCFQSRMVLVHCVLIVS